MGFECEFVMTAKTKPWCAQGPLRSGKSRLLAKPAKGSREKYRRFGTAADALRYAIEDLRIPRAFGAWLQVGDERFDSSEIQRLYEAEDYPLRKPE
jgi:hypothetical protein